MTEPVGYLLCKQEGMNSEPQDSLKKLVRWYMLTTPALGDGDEQTDPGGLLASQSSRNGELQAQ